MEKGKNSYMDNKKYLQELSDISARMSKILQEKAGNDTRGQIGKKLEEAENAREDATARITAAMEEGDSKALIKASRDQGEANLLIEMYEKQLDKIMYGPLITAEEYRELVQQLEQIEKRANAEGGQEIVTLALQIQTEAGKLREILGETDHLLRGLQCDIYRRADTGVKNGEIVVNPIYVFEEDEKSTESQVHGSLKRTENTFESYAKLRRSGINMEV